MVDKTRGAQLTGKHNITGKAPMLGSLAFNGGATHTFALLAGSPAVGKGSTSLLADQQGMKRPANIPTDIGAFATQKPTVKATHRASAQAKK